MDNYYLDTVVAAMQSHGIEFAQGLSEQELAVAEQVYQLQFPPDLRALLQFALPIGERCPNWRAPESDELASQLDWPADGICVYVQRNEFWLDEWGLRPASLSQAQRIAREAVGRAPRLVPIYARHYVPDRPCAAGNPVFAVEQADTTCCGFDLPAYFEAEFGVHNPFPVPGEPNTVELWAAFCDGDGALGPAS